MCSLLQYWKSHCTDSKIDESEEDSSGNSLYLPIDCCIGIEMCTFPNEITKRAHLQGALML